MTAPASLVGPLIRQTVEQAESRLRDDLHDSLEAMRGELRELVEARVGELEQRLEGVHREALRVLTDYTEKGK